MKTSVFNGEEGINIDYIFSKPQTDSDVLVVSFPGYHGTIPGGEWGYLMTITPFKVNSLFIRSNFELNQSWLTFVDRKPVIENAIKALIDKCAEEVKATRIIAIGSSMGGFCALYYGLKYDYDIISGSLPYTLTDPNQILFATGGSERSDADWFNEKVYSVIKNAGERKFNKKIFISWGEGESNWLSDIHGKKLVKDLEEANIKFTYKLYPFSNHFSVHTLFPDILKVRLGYYLGLNEEPKDDEEEFSLSPETRLSQKLKELYSPLRKISADLSPDVKPYTDINCIAHFGSQDLKTALRNFVYIEQGWYWGADYKEPIKMPDKNSFWRILPKDKVSEGVSFWFQDTLLSFYEKEDEIKALEWCAENARQYLMYLSQVVNPTHNENWWNSLRRMSFFMALHKDLIDKGADEDWIAIIPDEIRRDIGFFSAFELNIREPLTQYRRILGILHAAAYFREDKDFFDSFYNTALEMLSTITDYYFDDNGVCIVLQTRIHSILTQILMWNIRFIENNGFPETKNLRKLKRKYEKIVEFASHITSPNGLIAALGHSIYEQAIWTNDWIERKACNYILPASNIAFLNDENDLSYITVNGGSNVHSNRKHCDLLSFTWRYNNTLIFADTGGGLDALAEFAETAMAHNGIIVDDLNYMTPSYEDFSTIDTVDERDDCVILTMSHNCYDGVTIMRRLMWIKPNIIVLYDEAESQNEHKYTQNFILQDWNVDNNDKSKAIVSIAPGFTASVTQLSVDDKDFEVKIFRGTANVNDEDNYRGSLITAWRKLHKGCNIAYSKHGSRAKFLTVIELHNTDQEISQQENSVKNAVIEHDKIAVVLESGKEIGEKGLEELRKASARDEGAN